MRWLVLVALCLSMGPPAPVVGRAAERESFAIPYQLTPTRHTLVRAKINGKGPFNFIIDTGAPVLVLAKKFREPLGLTIEAEYWATIKRFEIEGGLNLENLTVRLDDLYQLEGMNGLGLAGSEIHGLIGYPVLSRFRIEYDYTQPKLLWTKLDNIPKEIPRQPLRGAAPGSLDSMGAIMKSVGRFLGMNQQSAPVPRGWLGFAADVSGDKLCVTEVTPGGPADLAGLKVGAEIRTLNEKAVKSLQDLKKRTDSVLRGDAVKVGVRHGDSETVVTIEAGRGL